MKHIYLSLFFFPMLVYSQANYELDFNNTTQDYVEMENASVVIANQSAFTISCWVNPQSNSNHGGIIGFRNNTDADFYLLQLQNTNNVEARFRNSSGVNYDIVATNILDFNQWQHLAFVYDGTAIYLYKDGMLVADAPANGVITQSSESFKLGSLDWQGTGFHLIGRLDEVRLWDTALSQLEIQNWMCDLITPIHPHYSSLMGYWRLNDGNGTIATDQSINNNNGILYNGVMWQTESNCLGISASCFISGNDTICDNDGDSAQVQVYFSGGISPYTFIYAINGINQPSITTTLNPYIIQTNQSGVYTLVAFSDANGSGTISGSALVTVNLSPIASFSAFPDTLSVASPETQFTDQSVYNIVSWDWDFGDGGGSSNEDPYYVYGAFNNIYTIELIVTDINGCSDTAFGNIWVVSQTDIEDYIGGNKLLKIINALGREAGSVKNRILFYIYDDGIVEKKIIVE